MRSAYNESLWLSAAGETCGCEHIQIIDDTLGASTDPNHLLEHLNNFVNLGEEYGLVEARQKRLGPARTVPFVGKVVSSYGISHPLDGLLKIVARVLSALTSFSVYQRFNSKRSIMGTLNWLTSHTKRARPFMSRLYQTADINVRDPYVCKALLNVFAIAALPASAATGIAPFLEPPTGIPVFYVDASKTSGLVGILCLSPTRCWTQRISVPRKYSSSQQLCELFGYLQVLRIIRRQPKVFSEVILVGDNSGGLSTLFTMRAPTRNFKKIFLTQQISMCLLHLRSLIHIRHTRTKTMLADTSSRNFVEPVGPRLTTTFQYSDVNFNTLNMLSYADLSLATGLNPPRVSPRYF